MLNLISSDIKLLFKFKSTKVALLLSVGLSLLSIFGIYIIIQSGVFADLAGAGNKDTQETFSREGITSSFISGFQAGLGVSSQLLEGFIEGDNFIANFYFEIFSGNPSFTYVVLYALIPNDVFFIFLIIICSVFIPNAFKNGSISMPISQGIARYKVFISKIIALFYYTFIFSCINFFTIIITNSLVIGIDNTVGVETFSLLTYFVFLQILYLAICSLLGMVAFIFRSISSAIIFNFIIIFGLSIASVGFASVGGFGAYDSFNNFWLTFQAVSVLENFPNMNFLNIFPSVLVVLIYIAVTMFIGIRHFNKKDI